MAQEHRVRFRNELAQLLHDLAELAQFTTAATDDASRALLAADVDLAANVIERRWRVETLADSLDTKTSKLITLQAPVAGDLRLLVSVLRASPALHRIGDLAIHIAEIVVRRYPDTAIPKDFRPIVSALADAVAQVTHASCATLQDGTAAGTTLRQLDDKVDILHRQLLSLLTVKDSHLRPDTTVDLTLLGRYYERIGDQAVNASAWRQDPAQPAKID